MALPEGAVPLVAGTVLALAALSVVLSPLIADDSEPAARVRPPRPSSHPDDAPTTAVDALREIEFDRETGKLSDSDYASLKRRYTQEALAELRAADRETVSATGRPATVGEADAPATAAAASLDAVGAAIARARRAQKECGVCGPRPEPDATYCSSCGRYLPGCCATCGASVDLVGSRYCSGCGTHLAAA